MGFRHTGAKLKSFVDRRAGQRKVRLVAAIKPVPVHVRAGQCYMRQRKTRIQQHRLFEQLQPPFLSFYASIPLNGPTALEKIVGPQVLGRDTG